MSGMWLLLLVNVSLEVRFEGKPLPHFALTYVDGGERRQATTDAQGVATLRYHGRVTQADFISWSMRPASSDYVFLDPRGKGDRWRIDAAHSAAWRQRSHPRPCDAWRTVVDIPRGVLDFESAAEYDAWYASLTPRLVANCIEIARIEKVVGSKAPWYFYEYKARPRACAGGKFSGSEEDWTAWYRGLLAEATHASPGKCVEDWERWWSKKGYPAIPER